MDKFINIYIIQTSYTLAVFFNKEADNNFYNDIIIPICYKLFNDFCFIINLYLIIILTS